MESSIWLGVYGIELFFFGTGLGWRFKRVIATVLILAIVASSVFLYGLDSGVWFFATMIFNIYRVFNLARVVKSRMHNDYLRRATLRTSYAVAIMTAASLVAVIPLIFVYLKYLPYLQLMVAAGIFVITVKNIHKLRFSMPDLFLVDKELPTVTVAIAARNETTDLEECLHSILDNDYPKLEIIVLDDCSQANTADIIKGFAHAGVRFIKGDEPSERWLAKNQAYEQLYKEASGEIILFCGVDVRFGRKAIRSMVNLLLSRNKSMLSVLPIRDRSTTTSAFIQPMRYWWELALPRRLFNKPPVLSTSWMISKDVLKKMGSFKAISHTLLPERYFARELVKSDKYSFIRSSNELEVRTVKSLHDQRQTAVRTLYPKIRRRPENALILTLINAVFLVGPFATLIASLFIDGVSIYFSASACALLIATHVRIVMATDPPNIIVALLTYPIAIMTETVMGYVSMIQYELFAVSWKDRNICTPVMHVIPKFPNTAETN